MKLHSLTAKTPCVGTFEHENIELIYVMSTMTLFG